MAISLPAVGINPSRVTPSPLVSLKRILFKPSSFCLNAQSMLEQNAEGGIMCEPCKGAGWLLCDFCKGQKNNVKSASSRIYRRCPSCKATGYILCTECKCFKCVTFPDSADGDVLSF